MIVVSDVVYVVKEGAVTRIDPTYGEVCEIVNAEWASAFGTSAALTAAHIMELSYPFGDDGTSGVER